MRRILLNAFDILYSLPCEWLFATVSLSVTGESAKHPTCVPLSPRVASGRKGLHMSDTYSAMEGDSIKGDSIEGHSIEGDFIKGDCDESSARKELRWRRSHVP